MEIKCIKDCPIYGDTGINFLHTGQEYEINILSEDFSNLTEFYNSTVALKDVKMYLFIDIPTKQRWIVEKKDFKKCLKVIKV